MILQVNLAATAALFGLIWYVQLAHYPIYQYVGASEFVAYHRRSTHMTTWVVLPLMLTELVSGAALWYFAEPGQQWIWLGLLGLIGVSWLSTLVLQVPCHLQLERGKDVRIIRRLVLTNWVRVAAWSLRTGWLVVMAVG